MTPTWSISTDPTPWPWGSNISHDIHVTLVKRCDASQIGERGRKRAKRLLAKVPKAYL